MVSRQKKVDQNSIMPTVERPSISSDFSRRSFVADPCKINQKTNVSQQCSS